MSLRDASRKTKHRIALIAGWGFAVLSVLILLTLLASTRFRASQVGAPFWRSTEIARGTLNVSWLTPDPDGSRPGFGNPGFRLSDSGSFGISVLPRARLTGPFRTVVIPLWVPLLACVFLTFFARRVARRYRDPGRCIRCGYSLDGLPAGTPCPECGHERAPGAVHFP